MLCAPLVLLGACARETGPASTADLTGLTVPLSAGGARLLTEGTVAGVPAAVYFDLGSPLSLVTSGCFPDGARVEGRVTARFGDGSERELPELTLRALHFAGHRHAPLTAALEDGAACEVTLGLDVLSKWALKFDLARRELKFLPAATRLDYQARALEPHADGEETHLLELTREPRGDWPLLAVRLKQGEESLTAPFVISTRLSSSRASATAVARAGLKVGRELFDGLPVPDGVPLPEALKVTDVVTCDAVELAPGVGLLGGAIPLDAKWKGEVAAGVLGGDVWGRFDALFDVQAGVLWLKRPRVLASGQTQRCVRGGQTGEEACYQLWARPKEGRGLEAAVTLWRALPAGGRLYLDVQGQSRPACRLGFTFGPTDRGAGGHEVFPWDRMAESMPACAEALKSAQGATLALFDEGPLQQCPGTCAFVEDLLNRKVSCACSGHTAELSDTDRALLKIYKTLLEEELKKRERATEPVDP